MRIEFVIISVAFALMGCATTRETNTISLDPGRTARYTIPNELAGDMNDAAVIANYAQAVKGATAYHLERRDAATPEIKGVRVSSELSGIAVTYLHFYAPTLHHNYTANFAVAAGRQGNDLVVDVTCPDNMRVEYVSPATGSYSPFIERDKAVADLRTICGKAQLTFDRRETGEVNVPFNDSAVYANFKRKLPAATNVRSDVKQGDLAKFLWFYVKDGAKLLTVGVTVFPYRNGSKVTYVWLNDIACRPNGPCNFDPTATKRLNEAIVAIAND